MTNSFMNNRSMKETVAEEMVERISSKSVDD
jgi:hypothetical protein